MSTWFITGCSTGLGRSIARAAIADGNDVVVTARDENSIAELARGAEDRVLTAALDVTDGERIRSVVSLAEDRFGGIDVLVNNAGYGYRSAIEEGEDDQLERLFATNVFGQVHLIQAVLPGMRSRATGTIFNITSIGVRISPAGSGFYAASKAAFEAISSSLRKETAPLGIRVVAVEPGTFRTDFYDRSLAQSVVPIDAYAATSGARRKENVSIVGTEPGDPDRAARALLTVAESAEPPALLLLGTDALAGYASTRDAIDADVERWRAVSASTNFQND
jgi:NAD(P)-dependent dehydrogenase (short-subunit alcohol dehydrogenase family)